MKEAKEIGNVNDLNWIAQKAIKEYDFSKKFKQESVLIEKRIYNEIERINNVEMNLEQEFNSYYFLDKWFA